MSDDSIRLCTRCGNVGKFSPNRSQPSGWHSECRACATRRAVEYKQRKRAAGKGGVPFHADPLVQRNRDLAAQGKRWCPQCRAEVSIEAMRNASGKFRKTCRNCGTAKTTRSSTLRSRYGISVEEYDRLLSEQCGVCAGCLRSDRRLCLDHDHETGKVRGILCAQCNAAIGFLGDDQATLERLIEYLRN